MEVAASIEEAPDEEIMRRIARGDQGAFAVFYDRHASTLLAVAIRILDDSTAAEDVVQDVFVHLWERAGLFDGSLGKPVGWAVAMARNKAIDRLRSRQRAARLVERATEEALADTTPTGTGVDSDRAEFVRGALGALGDEQRTAIELAFFGGLSQSEIAERTRKPLGTVKANIRRGMLKLRSKLQHVL